MRLPRMRQTQSDPRTLRPTGQKTFKNQNILYFILKITECVRNGRLQFVNSSR